MHAEQLVQSIIKQHQLHRLAARVIHGQQPLKQLLHGCVRFEIPVRAQLLPSGWLILFQGHSKLSEPIFWGLQKQHPCITVHTTGSSVHCMRAQMESALMI